MKMRNLYLGLFVVGTLIPYYFFISFLLEHGWNFHLMISQLFSNQISSFFAWDVIISTVVLLLFILSDISRETIKYLWMAIVATLIIGVSAGLPLFLYLRECYLEEGDS
jgi:hypothetical protein